MSEVLHKRSRMEIQSWLITRLADMLYLATNDIDIHESFHGYGLSSRNAVMLSGELEEWLACPLAPTLIWDYPSIALLAEYVATLATDRPQSGQDQVLESVQPLAEPLQEPVAIIGIGCRFPGAQGPEAFWKLLCDGVDAIREVPSERWPIEAFYDSDPGTRGTMNTRWGGFLEGVDTFDAQFFGISPREAAAMDPQQRLLMEVAWEALEDAGQTMTKLAGTETGVFIGIATNDYSRASLQDFAAIDAYSGTGSAFSIAANRLSYFFDWHGPSMAVDTACSSSLVALHLACQSLRNEEATLALAGGVNLILEPTYGINFTKAGAISPDGHCKAFAADANGYVRSEGVGLVVLKPLQAALRDGDMVYAVIRGSATNQDGRSNGLMAPSRQAQEKVLHAAYRRANVKPAQLHYIEAHGTGTFLGDPIEAQALGNVLAVDRPAGQKCLLGSVKTNIGHTEAAAGIAGVIKVALALKHGEIPPSLHFSRPNPHIPFERLPLEVLTTHSPWPAEEAVAGVSSFGFGGTNAHVVLSSGPKISSVLEGQEDKPECACILPLSARGPQALHRLAQVYQHFLSSTEQVSWPAVCAQASLRRTQHEHRLALVASSVGEAVTQLQSFVETGYSPAIATARVATHKQPAIVFVFPGQGSQWLGMGRALLREEPVFYHTIARCDRELSPYVSWSLLEALDADGATDWQQSVDVIQPMLFAIEVALAALWQSWGITPVAVVGHSMGEVAAAYVAGMLTLADACRLICARSQLLKSVEGRGEMLSVELSAEQVVTWLDGYTDEVSVAVQNGPQTTVLAGSPGAVQAIRERLVQHDIVCRQVKVDVAAHSPQMEPLVPELLEALANLQPRPAAVSFYSTVYGARLAAEEVVDATYWGRNLRQPVRFREALQALIDGGHDILLELSPHPILVPAIEQTLQQRQVAGLAIGSLRREQDERQALLSSASKLYTYGCPLEWSRLLKRNYPAVSLPTYPWQRQRYWLDVGVANGQSGVVTMAARHRQTDPTPDVSNERGNENSIRATLYEQADQQQKLQVLEVTICEHVAHILRMPLAQIEIDAPLMALGFDSIMALELQRRLQIVLGLQLPPTLLWQFPTIRLLALYFCQLIEEDTPQIV